jgi:histidinol-phosphate aminotransferase
MSKYWSEFVNRLEPYVPGEQPKVAKLIKLNTNENPYPPSPKVADVLSQDEIDKLRLYPDPASSALKNSIANYYEVQTEQVFIGNGSDEVLAHAFMAFFQQDKPLLYPDISYSFYPVYCNLYGIEEKRIPLADDFSIELGDYQQDNGGIIFPNPNAPTSIGLPLSEIKTLLDNNSESVVIVDEAYIDFGGESAVALVDQYANLLVVQTFSKSRSLAGSRVGFAIGHSELIEGLVRVKDSFNSYPIDRLAELSAIAAMEDRDYFQACCDRIVASRGWTTVQLKELGFEVLPSQANFVFAKPTRLPAQQVFSQLRDHNILVRYFNKPRISEYLRISIGTDEEMQALVRTLQDILS